MSKNYVFDIETMKNFFCAIFKNGKNYKIFEISSRKDDTKELVKFLKGDIKYLIGFNNVRFDMQVLELFLQNQNDFNKLKGSKKAEQFHSWAQDVINKARNNEFPPFPEYKLSVKQIDPFLINHYNNANKSTSLKWLQFAMNWKKVQDLPYKHDDILTVDKFDEVIEYCINDVDSTYVFAQKCKELIELRISQSEDHPFLGLRNKSDSSVGETLFLSYMADALQIDKKVLAKQQTIHERIKVSECILPYVNFKTPEFQSILDYMNSVIVSRFSTDVLSKNVMYKGIEYKFGEGGLHASYESKVFESDDEYMIIDKDVKSYYPNLSIRNRFYPAHLSDVFCDVYEDIYNTRTRIPKSDPRNYSYKIILNGVYGKSKDAYSFLYDQKFQLQITINGQLLLAMLAERLSFIEDCTIIQVNTDGITIKIKKSSLEQLNDICAKWEKLTKLELEEACYKKMVISNVNNYLAEYEDGKIKTKGSYEIDVDYHKNRSQRIVPIAIKRFFIDGIPVEETIKNHLTAGDYKGIENQGIFDFCIGKKIRSNQNYVIMSRKGEESKIHDKVIRYYISGKSEKVTQSDTPIVSKAEMREVVQKHGWRTLWNEDNFINDNVAYTNIDTAGVPLNIAYNSCFTKPDNKVVDGIVTGRFVKRFSDGREQAVNKGFDITMFMNYSEYDYNINYQYYINECNKIITPTIGGNAQVGFQGKFFD